MHESLPRWLSGKESACQVRRYGFDHAGQEDPLRRKWQPTPVFLPGESLGQGRVVDHGVSKSRTRLSE